MNKLSSIICNISFEFFFKISRNFELLFQTFVPKILVVPVILVTILFFLYFLVSAWLIMHHYIILVLQLTRVSIRFTKRLLYLADFNVINWFKSFKDHFVLWESILLIFKLLTNMVTVYLSSRFWWLNHKVAIIIVFVIVQSSKSVDVTM